MNSILKQLKREQDAILSELDRVKSMSTDRLGATNTFELLDRKLSNHLQNKLRALHSLSKNHNDQVPINKSLVRYQRQIEKFRLDLKSFKNKSISEHNLDRAINSFSLNLRQDPTLRSQSFFQTEEQEKD